METFFQWFNAHVIYFYLLGFAMYVGIEVVRGVSTILHTPLMSLTNAISGLVLIGGIALVQSARADDLPTLLFGTLAIVLASVNVFGGFFVTQRMLSKFRKK
jgi:NAD(P) transhydrogenase subunit alpha